MEIEILDSRHDLKLRKIPLTELILKAAYSQKIDTKLIREELGKRLKVTSSRISQFENILIDDTGRDKIGQKQITTINAFFSELLGEPVDITASVSAVGGGLF